MLLASKLKSIVHRGTSIKSIYPASIVNVDSDNCPFFKNSKFPIINNGCIPNCATARSSYSYPQHTIERYLHGKPPLPPYIHDFEFSTLVEMQQNACKKFKEKPLFGTKYRDNFKWMTYKEFNFQVASMRYVLEKHNIMKHDRVAIISNNRVEWAVAMYATMSLGAQVVPLYESQQEKDWKYILEDSRAKLLLVANEKIREQVKWYPENIGCVENILVLDRDDNCLHNLPK